MEAEIAGALIGLLAVLQIIVVRSPWYITGPENQFGGWLFYVLTGGLLNTKAWDHLNPSSPVFVAPAAAPWEPANKEFMMVFGFVLGAMIAKALEGKWRLRWPANRMIFFLSVVGGLMLGFGARLALGCNVGNFVATIQSLVFSGLIFFLGMAVGTFISTRLIEDFLMERCIDLSLLESSWGQTPTTARYWR